MPKGKKPILPGVKTRAYTKLRLLSDLMKYMPDVIYFKDRLGRLIMVNDAHAKGLGLKPKEVAGKTDYDIFPKERAQLMAKDDEYVMAQGKSIIDKVERSTRADGVDNYVSTTKVPRYDHKGRIVGLIGITRDISRRMQFENIRDEKRVIEKKLQAAQELNRVKSEFISVVSHELRTPLAIIKEAVALFLDEVTGELNHKQKQILLKAENNIKRLNGIIEDLLDISRIESGSLKLRYSLVNLADILKESEDFFKKQASVKGVSLEYILPKGQVNVFLDHNRINQVISNLISNAIKFTEEDGTIKVELKIIEDKLRFGVIDSGIGIAKENLQKLFNKFTQFSGISEAERKGVGLGLSIAKELINAHSGEIWAESKMGVGSRFYFVIPMIQSLNVLDSSVRNKINDLLEKGLNLYFVNLLIVNYSLLKSRIHLSADDLFDNLKIIIQCVFDEYLPQPKEKPQIAFLDKRRGECSFLLPLIEQKEADKINKAVLERFSAFLYKKRVKNVFISIGVASFPKDHQDGAAQKQQVLANLRVRKIIIGAEVRRFERIRYKLDAQVLFDRAEGFYAQTIDISKAGMSFYSHRALHADANVQIRIKLADQKLPIALSAKVAWVKDIPGGKDRYKIGLEFIHMNAKDKKRIAGLIQTLKNGG